MYKERLLQLKLPTLKYWCLRGDMIEVFKILTGKYDTNVIFSFEKHQDCRTRGNNLKLVNHRCHYDRRKYFFHTRIINIWNSLPESVISASTTDSFKNKLDKFWSRLRGDLIQVFRIVNRFDKVDSCDFFQLDNHSRYELWGHHYKLKVQRCRLSVRQKNFIQRVVNVWNWLHQLWRPPTRILSRRDWTNGWMWKYKPSASYPLLLQVTSYNKDLLYNYKAELTGIWNRSFINNLH